MKLPWTLRQSNATKKQIDRWLAFVNDPNDPRHGTQNGYGNLACRCPRCRAANVETMRLARECRASQIPADRHGRQTTYFNYSCRCSFCKEAHRLGRDIDPGNYPDRVNA